MRRLRIGTDRVIIWHLTSNGEPYNLTGKDITLKVSAPGYSFSVKEDLVIDGNILKWNFLGKDQKLLGPYTLTLIENDGKNGMISFDKCDAFALVDCSCKESGTDEAGLSISETEISTDLAIMGVHIIVPEIGPNGNWWINGQDTGQSVAESLDITRLALEGRFPNMSVGFADDLVGRGESTPAEFSFRASGGKSIKDGAARIKRLRGNSVVWNNVVSLVNMPANAAGVTATELDGRRIHLQGEFTNEGDRNLYVLDKQDIVEGHYYAVILQGSKYYGIYGYGGIATNSTDAAVVLATGTGLGLTLQPRTSIDAGTYVDEIVTPQIIDLTQMFGAGNEPTTIEEYYARKPIVADESAYNEGDVIHMTAEGIKSVGDNAWDEEWRLGYYTANDGSYNPVNTQVCSKNPIRVLPNSEYRITGMASDGSYIWFYDKDMNYLGYTNCYIDVESFTTPSNAAYIHFNFEPGYGVEYKNDIMVTLVHSGWKQDTDAGYQPYWEDRLMFDQRIKEHFPDSMKKWDMVYNKNGKGYVVKGTGVVDMGGLDWDYYPANESYPYGFFVTSCDDRANGVAIINARYANGGNFTIDKNVFGNLAASNVYSVDSDYTDAATFKAAMAGVLLYYELAEPTIIEYDEPFNFDYRVADFGTEQMLTEQPSAPIAADIIYQFNAVDMIREHELEIAELQSIIATMQAKLFE